MVRYVLAVVVLLIGLAVASTARADTIFGECLYKDGSRAGGEVGISTSWNRKRTSPANGRYVLDFGGNVRKSITVYVNGKSIGRVYVSGQTRLDITVP